MNHRESQRKNAKKITEKYFYYTLCLSVVNIFYQPDAFCNYEI
jgi:hypothetical protein